MIDGVTNGETTPESGDAWVCVVCLGPGPTLEVRLCDRCQEPLCSERCAREHVCDGRPARS